MDILSLANDFNLDPKVMSGVIKKAPFLYSQKFIEKKNGKLRLINPPLLKLKILQEKILHKVLYKNIELPFYLHGGIPGKSIISNARQHTGKQCVVCIDIKNFFPSIRITRLKKSLGRFFENDFVDFIVRVTTHNYSLPQGAPTSPFLSNLPFLDCDRSLYNLAKANRLSYSRYFDDITFSGKMAQRVIEKSYKIILQNGFKPNKNKTKIQKGETQCVTGICVARKNRLQPTPDFFNEVKKEIEELEHGIVGETDFIPKKFSSLRGKIAFMKGLGGGSAHFYEKTLDRLEQSYF